jgi:hypothetical protein
MCLAATDSAKKQDFGQLPHFSHRADLVCGSKILNFGISTTA